MVVQFAIQVQPSFQIYIHSRFRRGLEFHVLKVWNTQACPYCFCIRFTFVIRNIFFFFSFFFLLMFKLQNEGQKYYNWESIQINIDQNCCKMVYSWGFCLYLYPPPCARARAHTQKSSTKKALDGAPLKPMELGIAC